LALSRHPVKLSFRKDDKLNRQTSRQANPFEADSILYYPHIEFFSTEWLKRALTIWDRIYRIVPSSYTPNDTDEVREAADAGLVVDLRLTQEDLTEVSTDFTEFLDSLLGRPAGLCPSQETSTIHEEKVDARLRPLMRSLCQKVGADEWLRLPREIADGYMLFLAEAVARRRNLPRLTDDPDVFTVIQFYSCDGDISDYVYDRGAPEFTSALTMKTLIPSGIDDVPMRTILEFRKQSAEGRAQFRSGLTTLLNDLTKIEDQQFAQERVDLFMQELRSAPEVRDRGLKAFGDHFSSMLLSVALPTAMAAFSVLAISAPYDPFTGLNIGGSAAIGAIAALGGAGTAYRRGWTPSRASYFLDLESEFGVEHKLQLRDFSYRMEEFIND
jgi:hypothetical protein